jgi:hypothetical protein
MAGETNTEGCPKGREGVEDGFDAGVEVDTCLQHKDMAVALFRARHTVTVPEAAHRRGNPSH